MQKDVTAAVEAAVQELFGEQSARVELTHPEEQFGDFATNVALQLAKPLGKNPREIAEALAVKIRENLADIIAAAEVAGPGFINLRLSDAALLRGLSVAPTQLLTGQTWVIEYSCPNAFKELHTGHLYNTIAGDVLVNLVAQAGATVHRTSFGGDVGLHVGKCLWGILQKLGGEQPDKLQEVSVDPLERANWLSQCYVAGASAYEDDEAAKQQIIELNQAVYKLHENNDHDSPLAQIYWQCRQWSFDYFDAFYALIKVPTMRYYPESETTERGMATVKEQLAKGLLEESDGAVVFHGDQSKHLHTRVFVTSKGLPTYETKDVGVILAEQEEYHFDHRVLLTGNDQIEYMRVVFAAMDAFYPGIGAQMQHLTTGTVRFGDGQKMSSRKGNVSRAVDVVAVVKEKAATLTKDAALVDDVALGAIKYEFSRYRLGGDIAFDVSESVSLEGNSGPYLQYAHARARSILGKTSAAGSLDDAELEPDECSLVRKINEFPEVVDRAVNELLPHHVCTYLYELAQVFNRFYEHNRVIDDPRQAVRLSLVEHYADRLKTGLALLGIVAPDTM